MTQPQPSRDAVVSRVNELATTMLDTVAMLGLAAGLVLVLRPAYGWGGGLLAGSALLAALSIGTQWLHRPREAPPKRRPAPDLPGPADPGTVHVMGR